MWDYVWVLQLVVIVGIWFLPAWLGRTWARSNRSPWPPPTRPMTPAEAEAAEQAYYASGVQFGQIIAIVVTLFMLLVLPVLLFGWPQSD